MGQGVDGEPLAESAASQAPPTFRTVHTTPEPSREQPVRVAVVFASALMRRGIVEVLQDRPELRVVFARSPESVPELRVEDIDVAVVGMLPVTANVVADLAGRGCRVLAVMPPGMRGTTAIESGARHSISGTLATGEELVDAVLGMLDDTPPRRAPTLPGETYDVLGRLSQREREVLGCVAEGCTDREVGERLGISMRTVQSHLDRIREKTGRRRRAELTSLAFELGLVHHRE